MISSPKRRPLRAGDRIRFEHDGREIASKIGGLYRTTPEKLLACHGDDPELAGVIAYTVATGNHFLRPWQILSRIPGLETDPMIRHQADSVARGNGFSRTSAPDIWARFPPLSAHERLRVAAALDRLGA